VLLHIDKLSSLTAIGYQY